METYKSNGIAITVTNNSGNNNLSTLCVPIVDNAPCGRYKIKLQKCIIPIIIISGREHYISTCSSSYLYNDLFNPMNFHSDITINFMNDKFTLTDYVNTYEFKYDSIFLCKNTKYYNKYVILGQNSNSLMRPYNQWF